MKTASDESFIKRCIYLAEKSLDKGDSPFGSLVVKNGKVIAESGNQMKKDVTNHAEIMVMRKAQKILHSNNLAECVIYSNCEPCPMCSFMIRELKFKKVVFALKSRYLGGFSKWNILKDPGLEKFKPFFAKPPEVIPSLLRAEAVKTFIRAGWDKMF